MAEEKTELERPDIVIENDTATWQMKAEGAILGTYTGTFKFKCYMTPVDNLAAGREMRALLGRDSMFASENDRFTAYALSQLKYRVISGPPFWDSSKQNSDYAGNIPDQDVLALILDSALSAELKYKQMLDERKEEAIQRAKKAAEQIVAQNKAEDVENKPTDV